MNDNVKREKEKRKKQVIENRVKNSDDDNLEDLLVLYERGEISGDEMAAAADKSINTDTITPFENENDKVYLSLNILSTDEESGDVTFRMGIQLMYGMELTGSRGFVSNDDWAKANQLDMIMRDAFLDSVRSKRGTSCKYRSINGVSLVSMGGPIEWCTDGYYYTLMKMDHLGTNETPLKGNVEVYLVDDLNEAKLSEVLGAEEAQEIRDFYKKFSGSSIYDPEEHNQVVRGNVLKIQGLDKKNHEIVVSADDFKKIEVAVRGYNGFMNKNANPGEYEEHVKKMIIHDRLLT